MSATDLFEEAEGAAVTEDNPWYRLSEDEREAIVADGATFRHGLVESLDRAGYTSTDDYLAAVGAMQNERPPISAHDADLAAFIAWASPKLRSRVRYDHTRRRWHILNYWGHWAPDGIEEIHEIVEAAARAAMGRSDVSADDIKALVKLLDRRTQNAVLETLAHRPKVALVGNEFDRIPHLLGVANGVVDLRDGSLRKGRPDEMVSRSTLVEYDPDAKCPRFEAFLDEIMSSDAERVAFVRRWLGYSLWGFTKEQKFTLWVGSGQNGKGLLKRITRHIFGDYGLELPSTLYMKSRHGSATANTPRPELVELQGRRIGLGSEPEGGVLNEEMVKAHTGEDEIRGRALYSNQILNFYPSHTLNLLTNVPPSVTDVGVAMTRRLLVIPFEETFSGDREDLSLYDKLRAENVGVLGLLVREAVAYGRDGLGVIPDKVQLASAGYLADNNPLAEWMDERVIRESQATASLRELYQDYVEYLEGEPPISDTSFGMRLHAAGFSTTKVGGRGQQRKVLRGLRPRTITDP